MLSHPAKLMSVMKMNANPKKIRKCSASSFSCALMALSMQCTEASRQHIISGCGSPLVAYCNKRSHRTRKAVVAKATVSSKRRALSV